MNPRHVFLSASLAATLATAAWLATQHDEAPVVAAAPAPLRRPASAPQAPRDPGMAERRAWPAPPAATLAAWGAPASAAPAAPATAPPATVPAFPYKWIGRLDDGRITQALLTGPQRSFGAITGEVLDGRWRIESVSSARLELVWLPTGAKVSVEALR